MTITGQSGLSREEIDRMMRDAESHADEDRKRRGEAEVRNNADSLVYQTEKLLRDNGDKISGEEKSQVEKSLAELKDVMQGSDINAIRTASETVMAATGALAQRLYQEAAASGSADGAGADGAGAGAHDDEVVDAEIVDD